MASTQASCGVIQNAECGMQKNDAERRLQRIQPVFGVVILSAF
jgi:hypothetical protein